jgi:S-formylglutathione hydrolase FrmB
VKNPAWLVGLALALTAPSALAQRVSGERGLERVEARLHGQIHDYTNNHGADRRIWSTALCQWRDLYVYLPPCFDPHQCYPFMFWLHGYAQDEESFLRTVIGPLDAAIACGKLPPMIIAAPDGSLRGGGPGLNPGSFFVNSPAGNFEDYVMQDVWNFIVEHYPICPQRELHVLAGVSMGGGAAYNLAIKHRDRFKIVLGIFPPLNTRWMDCHGRYRAPFDPCCWGWRTDVRRGCEVLGRFYGVITIRVRQVLYPIFDRSSTNIENIARENPIEMLDRLNLQPGELSMYVAYGGRDEFNITAQVESFLYRAHQLGLRVDVNYDPRGRHNIPTALRFLPDVLAWLDAQLRAEENGHR